MDSRQGKARLLLSLGQRDTAIGQKERKNEVSACSLRTLAHSPIYKQEETSKRYIFLSSRRLESHIYRSFQAKRTSVKRTMHVAEVQLVLGIQKLEEPVSKIIRNGP